MSTGGTPLYLLNDDLCCLRPVVQQHDGTVGFTPITIIADFDFVEHSAHLVDTFYCTGADSAT